MKLQEIKETKLSFTLDETNKKRNFAIIFVSPYKRNFAKTFCLLRRVSCFVEQARGETGNPMPNMGF
jgi:hypothetical protein